MINPTNETAAEILAAARREGRKIERLPEPLRPSTEAEALSIQRQVVERLHAGIGGWKCSLPRGENVFLAPLPASTIYSNPPYPINPERGLALIEPEIAFVLGRDLPARSTPYSEGEVREAIAEARMVLELIGNRYVDYTKLPFVEYLADSINNQGLCVGPSISDPFQRKLDVLKVTVEGPNGRMTHDGRHPNGHPIQPLLWLANFFSSRGENALKKGMVITTGSYAGILEAPLDAALRVTLEGVGTMSVSFGSKAAPGY